MQAVRKARKDAHTGKKAHFFYRINRKEGNKGNKKRRGKEERRQGCRKNNGGKNHPEARRYPHGRRMLSENDRIFQFKPFQKGRKNKKERMEQEEQHPPTERLFPTIPFFNGKKELNPILLHFSQTGALF